MKRFLLPACALAALAWTTTACSTESADTSTTTHILTDVSTEQAMQSEQHTMHAAGDEHAAGHVYTCPMHPEVRSDQPGSCPKCGMPLEHTDAPAASPGVTYQMLMTTQPARVQAGQPVTFSFLPQRAGQEKVPVPLAVVHEKKMHIIIVSKDLSEFYHEHPAFTAQGNYDVPFTFKTGGEYVVFEDYAPVGQAHQLARQVLSVAGKAKVPVVFRQDALTWAQDDYAATLQFDKPVRVGQSLFLQVAISRGGQRVTDLDPYLGALGHMVVISQDTEQYLHVHPQDQPDKGPVVGFHTGFEQPGRYRVFLQFNHGGRIRTADFTVSVAPAAA